MRPITEVLRDLEAIRARTLEKLGPLTQTQLDWHPPDGEWSLGEIFIHLAIDEHYVREQIARPLLEGIKPPEEVIFLPPPPYVGAKKEVILYWFDRARTMTRRMLEAWPSDGNLVLAHIGGLEAMNSPEWLEGYGGHETFHHKQIDWTIGQLKEYDIK